MAAPIVQASYDELSELAARFGRQTEQTEDLRQRVSHALAPLERGSWQGDAATAFFNEMRGECFPALERLAQALDHSRGVTLQVSGILEDAESEAASLFAGGIEGLAKGKDDGGGGGGAMGIFEATEKALNDIKKIARAAQNAEINTAVSEGRYTDAIALASKYYNVDTSPSIGITHDAAVSGDGETSSDTRIVLGDDAFKSPGWLASTLEHELMHAQQAKDRWYPGPQGAAINEVEAYDLEIRNAAKNGLSRSELADIKSRRKDYYDALSSDIQKRVDSGDYTLPSGQTHL